VPRSLDATITIGALPLVSLGASICGVTEGDADPRTFIPRLIALYEEGRFPFDRLMTKYPLSQINEAIEDQHAGRCVKAVLMM
jgi:aryl-alcohol dehydrogenase